MCVYLREKYPILKRIEPLRQIIRWIALFEGVLALCAVSVKLVLLALEYDTLNKNGNDHAAAREQLTKIVVLSVFVIQTIFSLILFEGARKRILCMIKAWLFYCFLQLLIPMTMLFSNLFMLRNQQLPVMIWTFGFQVTLAILHGIEAIFVISFHKNTETELRNDTLVSIEYHKNTNTLGGISNLRKASDVSFSVNIDDESGDESSDNFSTTCYNNIQHS